MGISSIVNDGLIYSKVTETLTYQDVIDHIDYLLKLPDLENYYELIDFTNIKDLNVSHDEARSISNYTKILYERYDKAVLAIYAPNDTVYGTARMLMTIMEINNNSTDIQVFRDLNEATAYLKEKAHPDTENTPA